MTHLTLTLTLVVTLTLTLVLTLTLTVTLTPRQVDRPRLPGLRLPAARPRHVRRDGQEDHVPAGPRQGALPGQGG